MFEYSVQNKDILRLLHISQTVIKNYGYALVKNESITL